MRTLAIATALALPQFAHAQSFIGLGTFQTPTGLGRPLAGEISADGTTVVGRIVLPNGQEPAFRWTTATGVQSLGIALGADTTYATAASADGSTIVGYTGGTGPNRAWRWTAAAGITELLPLPGSEGALAVSISHDGSLIGGHSHVAMTGPRVVRWDASGTPEDIGLYPGDDQTHLWHLSPDGRTIVGWTGNCGRPFRWTEGAGYEPLPPQVSNGSGFGTSTDGSTVVGVAYTAGVGSAFRWTDTGGYQELGLLPGAAKASAWRCSADGTVIIGACYFEYPDMRAFLWTPSLGMVDLNEFLPSLGINLDGWILTSTAGISADGLTITGRGKHNGVTESWVAVIPCYPDCNEDGSLTAADFGCFQTRFMAGDPYADCNTDSTMTVADFGCFQTRFVAGCP